MRKYIMIGFGGFLGAILRYLIKDIKIFHYHGNIPINTLIINVTGTLVLALILTLSFELLEIDTDLRLGITTGFLGAFTTFSTLCKETVGLLMAGDYFNAISYLMISAILGLCAVYLGIVFAEKFILKLTNKKSKEEK